MYCFFIHAEIFILRLKYTLNTLIEFMLVYNLAWIIL